jgi:3'-phosphoadenosine 5'-phosphosulfate sulfotransferase (PAPS reductase)/FAD synthetase
MGHPRSQRYAIHADLGRTEWRETPEVVERQAAFLGVPLIVVRRRQGDMVSMWEQRYSDGLPLYETLRHVRLRGPWSSASQKFCQAGQKRDQFVKELARLFPGRKIVSVIGVRRDESHARSKRAISSWETKLTRADGTRGLNWNAIVDWTTPDVFAYSAMHGLPMHDAYGIWGSTRLSCALCVMSSRADVQASLRNELNHPLLHLLVGIEARTGFSFQQQAWAADARPDLLDALQTASIARAKAYSDERRAIEAQVPSSLLDAPKGCPWPHRMPEADEAEAIAESRRLVSAWMGKDLSYTTRDTVTDRFSRMMVGA